MDISQLDLEYLRYPYSLDQIRHPPEYIKEGKGPQGKRRIFYEVQFDDYEQQQIAEFHKELRNRKIVLPKGWIPQETLKFLYSARFDFTKAVEKVQKCLEWRNNPVSHTLTPAVKQIFESGALYIYGRDKQLRPILVFDLVKIDFDKIKEEDFSAAVTIMMDVILGFIYAPGKIENNVVIIDARKSSLTKLPLQAMKAFAQLATSTFPCTLHKCYVIGLPFIAKMSWTLVEGLMDKETSDKMQKIDDDELQILQELISPSQLEKKFGGTLPNLTRYWPPTSTFQTSGSLNNSAVNYVNDSVNTGRFATLQNSNASSLNRIDYQNPNTYYQSSVQQQSTSNIRYTSAARIEQPRSVESFSPDRRSRVSHGVSYTPTKERDENLVKEILFSTVKPTPPRSSTREVTHTSTYKVALTDDRNQDKQIERQLRSQMPALGDTSYREEESTLIVDSDILLPFNNPDMIQAIIREDNYLKYKNVASEERVPAEIDTKIRERKTIETKFKREVDETHSSPDRRSFTRPDHEQQFAYARSPNDRTKDDYDMRLVEWQPKKLRELPKPLAEEESDDDEVGFCGICVSRRKKKTGTQTVV